MESLGIEYLNDDKKLNILFLLINNYFQIFI